MKVIAYYLPQFYENENNNKWWGKGFTEWTNTSKAVPLFKGHYQPRIPLNQNYYDLSDPETMKWQAEIAKKYGVYGFNIYHYWFEDGNRMLEIPEQYLLEHPEIDIHYCLCWANEAWSRRWDGSEKDILMAQDYGDESYWINHFNYLLKYFQDPRYIRDNNKPMFVIFRPELIPCMEEMMTLWQRLAKENGLDGICFVFQHFYFWHYDFEASSFTYGIESQPIFAIEKAIGLKNKIITCFEDRNRFFYFFKHLINPRAFRICNYDDVWKTILRRPAMSKKSIPCAFTDWDNSCRVGKKGIVFVGATPEKFKHYFEKLIKKVKQQYQTDYLFIDAWNEWGEGAYLEPDEKYGYGYLEAIKEVLEQEKEMEQ